MDLAIIERENQRVLTTQQLATSYGTTEKVVSNNFNRNKERYQEGRHFYYLQNGELQEFLQSSNLGLQNQDKIRSLYLWTEKGALLHAKSLGTDEAWEVYDQLVESYFSKKEDLLAGLSTEMKALIMQDKKLQVIDQRVDKLENTMTIDYGQQQDLRTIANRVIVAALGGKSSAAYKLASKIVFAKIWHDFKEYFHINSYKNTPTAKFYAAALYLETWQPDTNMKLEIIKVNKNIA